LHTGGKHESLACLIQGRESRPEHEAARPRKGRIACRELAGALSRVRRGRARSIGSPNVDRRTAAGSARRSEAHWPASARISGRYPRSSARPGLLHRGTRGARTNGPSRAAAVRSATVQPVADEVIAPARSSSDKAHARRALRSDRAADCSGASSGDATITVKKRPWPEAYSGLLTRCQNPTTARRAEGCSSK